MAVGVPGPPGPDRMENTMNTKTRVGPSDVLMAVRDNPRRRAYERQPDGEYTYTGSPNILSKADILRLFDEDEIVMTSVKAGIDELIKTGLLVERGSGWLLPEDYAEIEENIARWQRNSERSKLLAAAKDAIIERHQVEVEAHYRASCKVNGLSPEVEGER